MQTQRGFTLVELLVITALAGIVLGVGTPQVGKLIRQQALTSQADEFVSYLYFARNEAIRRGERVRLHATGGSWREGWTVSDRGDRTLMVGEGLPRVKLSSRDGGGELVFRGSGALAQANWRVFDLCGDNGPGEGRQVVISPSGRIGVKPRSCN